MSGPRHLDPLLARIPLLAAPSHPGAAVALPQAFASRPLPRPARKSTGRPHNCGAALPCFPALCPSTPLLLDTLAPDHTTLASQATRLRVRQLRCRPRASAPVPYCARTCPIPDLRLSPGLPDPPGWTILPAGPPHPAGTSRWLRRHPCPGPIRAGPHAGLHPLPAPARDRDILNPCLRPPHHCG